MKRINQAGFSKNILLLISLVIFLVAIFLLKNNLNLGVLTGKGDLEKFRTQIIPEAVKKVVNNPSTKFTIGNVKDSNGVYEFELSLGTGAQAQKYTSYITKDGKMLFASGIKLDVLGEKTQNTEPSPTTEKKLTCNDLTKAEIPVLTGFIVAKCPYGLQMQRLFKKTIDELSQISNNLVIRYLGSVENGKITSMHGDEEAQENLKQICIREEQKDKYWNYVSCYMQEGKSDECLKTAFVDADLLSSCLSDPNKGLKYAKADFDLANKFNVTSSPTLLLNNNQKVSEFDFGGRIPNAIKEIVGCSYKTRPEAFKKDLSKDEVASSFSQTVAGSTTSGTAANCE